MRVSMTLPTMVGANTREQTLAWCRAIDAGPFHSLAVGERVAYPNLDAHAALAFAAAATDRVQLAPTIVVLPAHPEILVAKQLATIDVLSSGRLVVGVGVGGRQEDFVASGDRPFTGRHQRLDQQVATMRSVWSQQVPAGLSQAVGPAPVGPMPIMSGALGPRAVGRASRWAVGVNGFSLNPNSENWVATAGRVRDAWAAGGGSGRPYLATSFWYSVDPTGGADTLRDYARRYLGVFGAQLANAMAAMTTASSLGATLEALDAIESAGFDEVYLVPTSRDLANLDRLIEAIERRATDS